MNFEIEILEISFSLDQKIVKEFKFLPPVPDPSKKCILAQIHLIFIFLLIIIIIIIILHNIR